MPPILAAEVVYWGGAGLIAAFAWYMPGGGKDQVEDALKHRTSPPVMQMAPADQSEDAKDEAGKEHGAPTQNCPTCPPSSPSDTVPAPPPAGNPIPDLPANPDDLAAQGWQETTDPRAAANGNRRTFRNPRTGQELEFDKGAPGKDGFRGSDHYHVPNPDTTEKRDKYLDRQGKPVPKGSNRSHLDPDTGN